MGNNNKKNNNNESQEQVTDIKGTIVGFVAPEQVEQTQEEEIQNFKLRKQKEKEIAKLSEEEQKKKREELEKEEERLEKIKAELLKSIKERIPAIEKKFRIEETTAKKGKVVEKVKGKSPEKRPQKDADLEKKQNNDEKERE